MLWSVVAINSAIVTLPSNIASLSEAVRKEKRGIFGFGVHGHHHHQYAPPHYDDYPPPIPHHHHAPGPVAPPPIPPGPVNLGSHFHTTVTKKIGVPIPYPYPVKVVIIILLLCNIQTLVIVTKNAF